MSSELKRIYNINLNCKLNWEITSIGKVTLEGPWSSETNTDMLDGGVGVGRAKTNSRG